MDSRSIAEDEPLSGPSLEFGCWPGSSENALSAPRQDPIMESLLYGGLRHGAGFGGSILIQVVDRASAGRLSRPMGRTPDDVVAALDLGLDLEGPVEAEGDEEGDGTGTGEDEDGEGDGEGEGEGGAQLQQDEGAGEAGEGCDGDHGDGGEEEQEEEGKGRDDGSGAHGVEDGAGSGQPMQRSSVVSGQDQFLQQPQQRRQEPQTGAAAMQQQHQQQQQRQGGGGDDRPPVGLRRSQPTRIQSSKAFWYDGSRCSADRNPPQAEGLPFNSYHRPRTQPGLNLSSCGGTTLPCQASRVGKAAGGTGASDQPLTKARSMFLVGEGGHSQKQLQVHPHQNQHQNPHQHQHQQPHRLSLTGQPQAGHEAEGAGCGASRRGAWQRTGAWLHDRHLQLKRSRKVFLEIVRRKPWVLVVPLLLLLLLTGLGVFGVVFAAERNVRSQKAYAQEAVAATVAGAIEGQLEIATFAVMTLTAYLTQQPYCDDLNRTFLNLSATTLQWDEKDLVYQLQALPAALLNYIYKPVTGDLAQLLYGRDLLRVPMYRNDTLFQIRYRKMLLLGPYSLLEGFQGMFVTIPVFLPAPNETYDWGCNAQPYECPAGLCWVPSTGEKLWGLVTSVVSLDNLQADFRFKELQSQGYRYRLQQQPDIVNQAAPIAQSDPPPVDDVDDPVHANISKFNLHWTLYVAPAGGWLPNWRDPCIAAVVVGSSIVAGLVLWVLVTQEKHNSLLQAMLPRKIIWRLQRGEQTVVEEFKEPVTILFSDIVSYTEVASQLSPLEVVRLLNELYTRFDALCDKHEVYKVETIGDAFMCVSGCPVREDPVRAAVRMAGMAQAMIAMVGNFVTRVGKDEMRVKIRIGLHSGPVVAGVIGHRMPRYCLFGDTVNTASRMETNSSPMCIHLSAATASLLRKAGAAIVMPTARRVSQPSSANNTGGQAAPPPPPPPPGLHRPSPLPLGAATPLTSATTATTATSARPPDPGSATSGAAGPASTTSQPTAPPSPLGFGLEGPSFRSQAASSQIPSQMGVGGLGLSGGVGGVTAAAAAGGDTPGLTVPSGSSPTNLSLLLLEQHDPFADSRFSGTRLTISAPGGGEGTIAAAAAAGAAAAGLGSLPVRASPARMGELGGGAARVPYYDPSVAAAAVAAAAAAPPPYKDILLVAPLVLYGRGRVLIKGKGLMHTFWLGHPPSPPSQLPTQPSLQQGPTQPTPLSPPSQQPQQEQQQQQAARGVHFYSAALPMHPMPLSPVGQPIRPYCSTAGGAAAAVVVAPSAASGDVRASAPESCMRVGVGCRTGTPPPPAASASCRTIGLAAAPAAAANAEMTSAATPKEAPNGTAVYATEATELYATLALPDGVVDGGGGAGGSGGGGGAAGKGEDRGGASTASGVAADDDAAVTGRTAIPLCVSASGVKSGNSDLECSFHGASFILPACRDRDAGESGHGSDGGGRHRALSRGQLTLSAGQFSFLSPNGSESREAPSSASGTSNKGATPRDAAAITALAAIAAVATTVGTKVSADEAATGTAVPAAAHVTPSVMIGGSGDTMPAGSGLGALDS